jgi:hypothetical protein
VYADKYGFSATRRSREKVKKADPPEFAVQKQSA